MTKEQVNEFLGIVKGRKIKLAYWPEDRYVIPNGEWKNTSDKDYYYWKFWCINETGKKDWWFVYGGFEESNNGDDWVLVETFEDYLERYHKED